MESDLIQSEAMQLSENVGSDAGTGLESNSMGMGICVQPEEVIETSVLQSAGDYDANFGDDEQFVDSILVPQTIETETVTSETLRSIDVQEAATSVGRCITSKRKRGGARPNAGRKKIHELPRMQRNIRIEISRSVHERYKEQKKKLGFQNDSQFVDHLLLIHQHYIDFYANQSWVNNQQEVNLITNIPSTQPSVPNVNQEETVTVRDGSIAFSEAAIQVDTDLFVYPSLQATTRTDELEDVVDDSGIAKKGSEHNRNPQSTNN